MELSTNQSAKKTLHYLGPEGSYHSVVAQLLADEYDYLQAQSSFEKIYESMNETNHGLVAIENSHTGDIQPNFTQIISGKYQILGEFELAIHHMLLTHPSKTLYEVNKIYIHPQIYLQCSNFLHSFPQLEKITVNASSEGAEKIRDGEFDAATIGGSQLADTYGLVVRQENVGNVKNNVTRFFRIKTHNQAKLPFCNMKKVAMIFRLPHTSGSLSAVLGHFASLKANLTKIESIPLLEKVWEYQFYVEFVVDMPFEIDSFKDLLTDYNVIGVY